MLCFAPQGPDDLNQASPNVSLFRPEIIPEDIGYKGGSQEAQERGFTLMACTFA